MSREALIVLLLILGIFLSVIFAVLLIKKVAKNKLELRVRKGMAYVSVIQEKGRFSSYNRLRIVSKKINERDVKELQEYYNSKDCSANDRKLIEYSFSNLKKEGMIDIKLFRNLKGDQIEIKLDQIQVLKKDKRAGDSSSDDSESSSDEESKNNKGRKSSRPLRGNSQLSPEVMDRTTKNAIIDIPQISLPMVVQEKTQQLPPLQIPVKLQNKLLRKIQEKRNSQKEGDFDNISMEKKVEMDLTKDQHNSSFFSLLQNDTPSLQTRPSDNQIFHNHFDEHRELPPITKLQINLAQMQLDKTLSVINEVSKNLKSNNQSENPQQSNQEGMQEVGGDEYGSEYDDEEETADQQQVQKQDQVVKQDKNEREFNQLEQVYQEKVEA